MKRKVISYKLWVISSIVLLFFLQSGCYAQIKDNLTNKQTETQVEDPYSWDFGQVKEGEVLKHIFVLKNESEATLTIKDVNTSCGCTASKVEKKILLPGQSATIEVRFNSKGYSGPVQQYVYVHTDSLDKPVLRFIIKAEVATTETLKNK
ncbi:MAG: hypothetical protein COX40_00180 [Candidatus Omnitrophica bacterium CG23_combo_of_CG06-09_8_20_14_all_40_11]|nr:MAG: hypothetical protein COX40_00180 [Candidatus Omnitrophica bacterium CG23_combo_of_CG06-09_8_20_14_all_40_11]